MMSCLAVRSWVAGILLWQAGVRSTKSSADGGARAGLDGRVGAKHANSGAELGSAEGHHVLANMLGNDFPVLRVGVSENVLDEVVAILVTRDVNQRNARAVETTLTDTIKITTEEINTPDLETLLNNLGCELIHAVL